MRIPPSSPFSPLSPSSSPSSSSSIHSTISTQSLSSSSSSSSSSPPILTTTTTTTTSPSGRCQGLDLLVKAAYHVAGSVIGVPYIQRRLIRRRKPAIRFQIQLQHPLDHHHHHELAVVVDNGKKKPRRRSNFKNKDSVLSDIKSKDPRKRRSSKT